MYDESQEDLIRTYSSRKPTPPFKIKEAKTARVYTLRAPAATVVLEFAAILYDA
jgi:hypothetical protein